MAKSKSAKQRPDVEIAVAYPDKIPNAIPTAYIRFNNQKDTNLGFLCVQISEQTLTNRYSRLYFTKGHQDTGGIRLDIQAHIIQTSLPSLVRLLAKYQGEYTLYGDKDAGWFVSKAEPERVNQPEVPKESNPKQTAPSKPVENSVHSVEIKSEPEPEFETPETAQIWQNCEIQDQPEPAAQTAPEIQKPAAGPVAELHPVPIPASDQKFKDRTAAMRVLIAKLQTQISPENKNAAATAAVLSWLINEL